jgi:ABC-type proline/glycine betaine transport system ATPase subunit
MGFQVPEGCGQDRIVEALTAVGFSEERQAAAVSELSGGWRMKLAIARSMLWDAGTISHPYSFGWSAIDPLLPQTCFFWTSRRITWTLVPSNG